MIQQQARDARADGPQPNDGDLGSFHGYCTTRNAKPSEFSNVIGR
jgi:hypothetical protein